MRDSGGCRVVVGFLAEAAAAVNRKPQVFFELALELVKKDATCGTRLDAVQADVRSISMLVLCAVRQAFRVCGSAKRSLAERAAICSFVSGGSLMDALWVSLGCPVGPSWMPRGSLLDAWWVLLDAWWLCS
jgi:hypothetical protein